jgi:3-oxoadipate enol-lactonase
MQVLADDGVVLYASVNARQRRNALLLIHGFPFSSRVWDAQTQAVEQNVVVIRPDLRGAGQSGISPGPYLMETLAADVATVLDAIGVERVSVAGHSMGGYVAMAFLRMFSERVERLALIASRLRADTPSEAKSRLELADRLERERSMDSLVESMLPRLFGSSPQDIHPETVERAADIVRNNDPLGAAAALRGMALRSSSEDIAEDVDVPVLIVAGGRDRTIPLGEARENARQFRNARLVICEDSGHLPMLEEPGRLSGALSDWLGARASG